MGKIWEMVTWYSEVFKSGCTIDISFGLRKEIMEKNRIDRQ